MALSLTHTTRSTLRPAPRAVRLTDLPDVVLLEIFGLLTNHPKLIVERLRDCRRFAGLATMIWATLPMQVAPWQMLCRRHTVTPLGCLHVRAHHQTQRGTEEAQLVVAAPWDRCIRSMHLLGPHPTPLTLLMLRGGGAHLGGLRELRLLGLRYFPSPLRCVAGMLPPQLQVLVTDAVLENFENFDARDLRTLVLDGAAFSSSEAEAQFWSRRVLQQLRVLAMWGPELLSADLATLAARFPHAQVIDTHHSFPNEVPERRHGGGLWFYSGIPWQPAADLSFVQGLTDVFWVTTDDAPPVIHLTGLPQLRRFFLNADQIFPAPEASS